MRIIVDYIINIKMKSIIISILLLIPSVAMYSQTREQLSEWIHKGKTAFVQGEYQDALLYIGKIYELYEKNEGLIPITKEYGDILYILAESNDQLENYGKAVEYGKRVVDIYKTTLGENHPDYATSLQNLANYFFDNEEYGAAVEFGERAMKIRKTILGKNHLDYVQSLLNLASFYSGLNSFAKAVEYGSMAWDIAKNTLNENHPYYISLLTDLTDYYFYLGNYFKSIEFGNKALATQKKLFGEVSSEYANTLNILAISYHRIGDFKKAIELGNKSVEIFEKTLGKRHPEYAMYISDIADFYLSLGDYSKAVELCTKAMGIQKEILGERHHDYAILLDKISSIYRNLGDYSKALDFGNEALNIKKETLGENHLEYATSLNNLSIIYFHLGDYSKALEYESRVIEIHNSTIGENHPEHAKDLNNLAGYYSYLGDYSRAVQLGNKAIEIQRKALGENNPDYARYLSNLAVYYSNIEDYSKAIEYGTKALEIRKSTLGDRHPLLSLTLLGLSYYYSQLGDFSKAEEFANMALYIQKETLGENHPDYAYTLARLSLVQFYLGNHSKAIELINKTLNIQRESLGENHPNYARSLEQLSAFYTFEGDYSKAYLYNKENVSINYTNILHLFSNASNNLRTSYWNTRTSTFTDYYPYLSMKSPSSCSTTDLYDKSALFAKGLLLTTEMEMNRLIQESGDEEALRMFEELRHQRFQLQKLYETPLSKRYLDADSLAQVADQLERKLVVRSKVYGDFTKKLRTTWQDVQKSLTEDEIAIEFLSFNVYGTDSTMVAALTLRKDDKEPKFVPLFELGQLQGVSDTEHFICSEVARLVWEPLQKELRGIRRIYFSPAGVLHTIAIEYTPGMEEYEMCRLSTTREIIDIKASAVAADEVGAAAALYGGVDYETMNSTKLVLSTETQNPSTSDAFTREFSLSQHRAFVDSLDLRGQSISYLPSTLDEVKSIQASLEGSRRSAKVYVGPEATETSLKSLSGHSPNVLHLATHGFYFTEKQSKKHDNLLFLTDNDQRSGDMEDKTLTRSGLFMAGANKVLEGENVPMDSDDGILTAREISRLDLRGTDLVVLSACETGKGDIKQGEGVFGLQRSFKKAGAKTIVMSLWNVSDLPTQMLMTEFYKNLCSGKGKRESLRLAQKTVREYKDSDGSLLFQNPHYWAGFVILD